jgi:hypothetical protein
MRVSVLPSLTLRFFYERFGFRFPDVRSGEIFSHSCKQCADFRSKMATTMAAELGLSNESRMNPHDRDLNKLRSTWTSLPMQNMVSTTH